MRHTFTLGWFSILMLAIPLPIQAAEWSASPKVSLSTAYNDNVNFTTAKHDAVWQTNLDSSVGFGVAEQNQGLFGDAGFSVQRFTGGSGRESSSVLNRENYHLNTRAYRNTLLDTFSVNLNITRNSTLESELDEIGNVSNSRATRQRISLAPSWGRTLNKKTFLNMNAIYTQLTFPDDPGVAQVESDSYSLLSNLSYRFSPLLSGNLSASYNSFQPDRGFNSDTISLQAGITRAFSKTLTTSWLVGRRETTSDSLFATGSCLGADPGATFPTCTGGIPIVTGTTTGETRTAGLVYTVSLSKLLETGSLDFFISRSTSPTSTGELLDSTRASIIGIHQLSSSLRAVMNISYVSNETIVNSIGRNFGSGTNKYLTIIPALTWEWDRQLKISLRYSYGKSETAGSDKKATRNTVSVRLSYDFQKLSVSR